MVSSQDTVGGYQRHLFVGDDGRGQLVMVSSQDTLGDN